MYLFHFYLTNSFKIEAALDDRPDAMYIRSVEMEPEDMYELLGLLQATVDGMLSLQNKQRMDLGKVIN